MATACSMGVKASSSGSFPGAAGACCAGLLGFPSSGPVVCLVRDVRLALRGPSLLMAFPMYFRAPFANDPGPDSRGVVGPTVGSVALFVSVGSDQASVRVSRISRSMDFHESQVSLRSASGPPSPSLVCAGAGVGAGVSVVLASSSDMLALGVLGGWGVAIFEKDRSQVNLGQAVLHNPVAWVGGFWRFL